MTDAAIPSSGSSSGPSSRPPGIVIVGPPRSGTTLLRRILDAHPRIACPPETNLLAAAARFLHEDRFASGLRIGVLSGLSFAGVPEHEVLARLRALVLGLFDDHARAQGKPRWAEKSAFDAFHLPAIERLLGGHVRFVCLQRHGLDVVCSLAELVDKTGGWVQELHAYLRHEPEPLVALAHAWVDAATHVAELAQRDPSAIEVRYEDLVREPEVVVRRVLERVGEPYDEALLARALAEPGRLGFGDWKTYGRPAIDDGSVGRFRALPGATASRLAEVCNPTLVRLGYEPVDVDDPRSEDDARHRYVMGLRLHQLRGAKPR